QPGGRDRARFEGGHERLIVDDVAAGDIADDGIVRQAADDVGIDQAARTRIRRARHAKEIAVLRQAGQRVVVYGTLFLVGPEPAAVVVVDLHSEAPGAPCDGAADT